MTRKVRSYTAAGLAAAGFGLCAGAFVPKANADEWSKRTIVTVNEPIIAGNKVLEPGTYVWRLMDSPADRHVVQIYDRDQQHLETTVLAIPDYRLHPKGHTQFTFWETPPGVPKAVQAWFYPGDNYGQEFAYPKKLVAQLASARPVPLPAAYQEPAPVTPPPAQAAAPEPVPQPQEEAKAEPAPQPQPEPQAQPAPAPAPAAEPAALPHTASFNPLIGMLGAMSLTAAGLLGLADRRAKVRVRK